RCLREAHRGRVTRERIRDAAAAHVVVQGGRRTVVVGVVKAAVTEDGTETGDRHDEQREDDLARRDPARPCLVRGAFPAGASAAGAPAADARASGPRWLRRLVPARRASCRRVFYRVPAALAYPHPHRDIMSDAVTGARSS